MSQSQLGRTCEVWHPRLATNPIAPARGREMGLAIAQERSRHRYQRRPARPVASELVVHAVVLDRCALRFAVPDSDRTGSRGFEHDLANSIADQFRHASACSSRSLAERPKLFFTQIDFCRF